MSESLVDFSVWMYFYEDFEKFRWVLEKVCEKLKKGGNLKEKVRKLMKKQ